MKSKEDFDLQKRIRRQRIEQDLMAGFTGDEIAKRRQASRQYVSDIASDLRDRGLLAGFRPQEGVDSWPLELRRPMGNEAFLRKWPNLKFEDDPRAVRAIGGPMPRRPDACTVGGVARYG